MENHWRHHFKYYDLFLNNSERYRNLLEIFIRNLMYNKRILDTGAGSGNLTLELLKQNHKVTAIDNNHSALSLLKRKCFNYKNNLEVYEMDVQKIELERESFDAVTSMFVVPFVEDNLKYFSETYKVLKKRGKFIISAWSPMPDAWYGIVEILKKELIQKGILPKHKREWEHMMESTKINLKQVINGSDLNNLKKMLKETGFNNISLIDTLFGKYVYFLICEKEDR